MYCHYLHRIARCTSPRLIAALRKCVEPFDKAVKSLEAGRLEALCVVEKQHYIIPARRSVGHRRAYRGKVELIADIPQKLSELHIGCALPQLTKHGGKLCATGVIFRVFNECGIEIAFFVRSPYLRKLVRREAEKRRAQNGYQRNILMRIIYDRKQANQRGHLDGFKITPCAASENGNIGIGELAAENVARGSH